MINFRLRLLRPMRPADKKTAAFAAVIVFSGEGQSFLAMMAVPVVVAIMAAPAVMMLVTMIVSAMVFIMTAVVPVIVAYTQTKNTYRAMVWLIPVIMRAAIHVNDTAITTVRRLAYMIVKIVAPLEGDNLP
jgi:hypothetical protein